MTEYYVKFKGRNWIKVLVHLSNAEEWFEFSHKDDIQTKLMVVNKGENWKYKWMEQDDLNG